MSVIIPYLTVFLRKICKKMRIVIRQSPYYDSHSPQYSLSKNNTNSELNSKFVLFTSGAEDEIWTRATITDATPLAGEPLEPLGYFCNVSKEKFSISCFNAILLYHISIEKSKLFTRPNQKFRVKNRKNEKFFFQSVVSLDFLTKMWYNIDTKNERVPVNRITTEKQAGLQ